MTLCAQIGFTTTGPGPEAWSQDPGKAYPDLAQKRVAPSRSFSPGPQVTLDEFEVLDGDAGRSLGKGSFGVVRRIRRKGTGEVYALKTMQKIEVIEGDLIDQVEREIQVQRSLKHENVLRLYKHFEDAETVYLLLEYCAKGELYQLLRTRRGRRFPESVARHYFVQVVRGLRYLHGRNIVHRDLKPENLLVNHEDVLKIADFGWCAQSSVLRTTFCGTLDYLAPEMIQGKGHNHTLDIWSLGVLLYEMVVGRPPFQSTNHVMLISKILANDLRFPNFVPPDVVDLVQRLLRQEPTERLPIDHVLRHPWAEEPAAPTAPAPASLREPSPVPPDEALPKVVRNFAAHQGCARGPAPLTQPMSQHFSQHVQQPLSQPQQPQPLSQPRLVAASGPQMGGHSASQQQHQQQQAAATPQPKLGPGSRSASREENRPGTQVRRPQPRVLSSPGTGALGFGPSAQSQPVPRAMGAGVWATPQRLHPSPSTPPAPVSQEPADRSGARHGWSHESSPPGARDQSPVPPDEALAKSVRTFTANNGCARGPVPQQRTPMPGQVAHQMTATSSPQQPRAPSREETRPVTTRRVAPQSSPRGAGLASAAPTHHVLHRPAASAAAPATWGSPQTAPRSPSTPPTTTTVAGQMAPHPQPSPLLQQRQLYSSPQSPLQQPGQVMQVQAVRHNTASPQQRSVMAPTYRGLVVQSPTLGRRI